MDFQNKINLTLSFAIRYPSDIDLAILFGVSNSYVSCVVTEILPHLVEYFSKYIPNKNRSKRHS
jgi:hypothetical protein